MMKKIYFAIPSLAIALHLLLSNLLYFLVERLVLDVFHISPQQFMNYSYWGEILIYAVLIARDGTDVYVHDIGVGFLSIAVP